ncbi:MAG: hypothetical protein AB1490_10975 [Pseudomonadota bacterium]
MNTDNDQQDRDWNELYEKVTALLHRYGRESATGEGDFSVLGDNYNDRWFRQIVYLFTLKLLDLGIVAELRELLRDFPGWEIVMAIDVPGKEEEWPRMGLRIRHHEVIDSLSRDHLPEPYKSLVIPDSRPGTGDADPV